MNARLRLPFPFAADQQRQKKNHHDLACRFSDQSWPAHKKPAPVTDKSSRQSILIRKPAGIRTRTISRGTPIFPLFDRAGQSGSELVVAIQGVTGSAAIWINRFESDRAHNRMCRRSALKSECDVHLLPSNFQKWQHHSQSRCPPC